MPAYKNIEWLPEARELLARRDRFTQSAIKKDFAADPERDKVALDAEQGWYATPVADNRYTVIWRVLNDNAVQVKAVVASQFRGETAAQLKEKLEETVKVETHGAVKSLF